MAALSITGLTGETAPAVETDLGSVQCVRLGSGWRAYIPAAYNASAGGHTVNVTVNGETFARTLTVLPKDFGTVEVEPEPVSTEAANTEFRNNIWPLYEQPVREKLWAGAVRHRKSGEQCWHPAGDLPEDGLPQSLHQVWFCRPQGYH